MPRVDVWDVAPEPVAEEPLWCGFPKAKLEDKYELGRQLGSGGFGSVRLVVDRSSGKELAAKSIAKRLNLPNVSPKKQEQHLENIRREALILRKLRGTLNVVHLEDVFEDEEEVHVVQELCKGGELVHRIKSKHYSERTAASYMRAVLRTLAQCHHLRILHRDIKPGNFMLLTEADNAPVKAIDFGLAVFFDPKKLPRTDLGLEGTPHFMAPEQLSGKTEPASDIWAAGVMAHQLLSGNMPFEDWKNPKAPSLSLVWRSILTEEPKMSGRSWEGISEQAKDFVRSVLVKDPKERPTAKQALSHPWLQGKSVERNLGKPLARTVVQRLQKFGVESLLKRTVLDMIANDLINRHMEQLRSHQVVTAAGPGPGGGGAAAASVAGETGEATPEGAAAAATHRKPPAASADAVAAAGGGSSGAAAAAAFAANSAQRWRQLAAQDLLMQTAHKAATVHAGGEALAALKRLGHVAGASGAPANREGSAHAPGSQRRSHDVTPSGAVRPFALTRATTYGALPSGGDATGMLAGMQGRAELAAASPAEPMQSLQRHNDPIAMETGLAGGSPPPLPRSSSGRLGGGGGIPLANVLSPPVPGVPFLRSTSYQRLTAAAAAAYAGSGGSIHGGGSGSIAAAAGGGSAHGGVVSPLAPAGGSGGRLGTVAAAAAAAAGSGYKGPVKDTAAAAAWDMNFMASRLAAEGSGHALQHYAWLLNMGERSLHGVIERSYHGGRHHTPAAEPVLASAGGSEPHPAFAERRSTPARAVPIPASAARRHAPGSAVVGSLGAAGPLGAAPRSLGVGSVPGFLGTGLASGGSPGPTDAPHGEGDGYLRMLSLVARQRAEHRKVQRLALDTSGHRQTHYQDLMRRERGEASMDTPEEGDEAAEDDCASSAAPSAGTTGTWSAHVTQHNSAAALPSPRDLQQQQRQDKSPPQQQQQQQQQPTAVRSTPFSAAAPAAATPAASSGGGDDAPCGGRVSRNDTPSLVDLANAAAASLANPLFASPYAHPLLPTPASTPPQPQLLPPSTGHPLLPTPNSTPTQPHLQQQQQEPPQSQPQYKTASVGIPGLREVEEQEGKAAEGAVGVARRASEGGRSCSSGGGVGSHGAEEHHYQHEHESLLALAEAEVEGREGTEAAEGAGQAEEGRRGSLLDKVRKALMKPVKNLLSNAGGSATSSSKSLAAASAAPGSRTPGGLSRRSLGAASALMQEGGEGSGGGSLARASVAALPVTEERGRGRGAYAAFLQQAGTGTNTPQDRSGHGGREATAGATTASATAPGASSAAAVPAEKAALPFPAGFAIHTVKAHKQQQQDKEDAAADAGGRSAIALETERGPTSPTHDTPPAAPVLVIPCDDAPAGPGTGPIAAAVNGSSALAMGGPFALASRQPDSSISPGASQGVQNPTNHGKLKQGELVSVLGMLLGDNTCQGAELHDVLRRLQFDASDSEEEVTFEQLSEGLQRLGYRLEPGELEDLLRQVGVGSSEGLTASQFIASQVDWRAFSVNHRAEWLHCLRKAFEELGGGAGPDGRVSLDTLLGSLTDKLPEEEVNLAVQESLMDAAVEADAVDFESFVRLMRCNSNDSLQSMGSSELSYDLYDPRIKDPSVHGPAHGEGLHAYHPALETVPDTDAADD